MDDPDIPTVTILLLGNPSCGKSTFLSRLSLGRNALSSPTSTSTTPLPCLHDLDQPFVYEISMYNRPYRFEFYDTASPENWTLLHPDFVICCFDVSDRGSLEGVRLKWRKEIFRHFQRRDETIPVMLLGLKRDSRGDGSGAGVVDPQEGYRVAGEIRCDRYAECSAVTGELMQEVFEDVARVAAKTTTENGGQSAPSSCEVM